MSIGDDKKKFVVAVSGGVDSVLLLKLLHETNNDGHELIVAHFDHGIRADSASDAQFVADLAHTMGLTYISDRAELGAGASEEQARDARYAFLRRVMQDNNAQAIYTAHHQNDLLETMVMHLLRGTGRRGLDPMRATTDIERPLLYYSKKELLQSAADRELQWRHDSTNDDMRYFRNRIRRQLASANPQDLQSLLSIHYKMLEINNEINSLLKTVSAWSMQDETIIRSRFVTLPHAVQKELVMAWLLGAGITDITSQLVSRAVLAITTGVVGTKINLSGPYWLLLGKNVVKILQK